MIRFNESALEALTNKGAFLTSGTKPNVMTVSWGLTGVLWGKKIAIVPVRDSRYTREFIEKTGEFTLSIPFNKYEKELKVCGSKSGRDVDKIEELHLMISKAKHVDTYLISGCDAYFECKVITKLPLEIDSLPKSVQKFYANGDKHNLYIAEILN